MDLMFSHHDNEIVQNLAANRKSRVNYWMHNGLLRKNGERISKSDDTAIPIRKIIARYDPLAIRYYLMRTHYRSDISYSDRHLDIASDHVFDIYQMTYIQVLF